MNKFMTALKNETNYTYTENGALTYKSTMNGLLDLFALGGAYRTRSDADVVNLFMKAFAESEKYALKCLFYLRDVRGGQGERRFFRVVTKWLAREHTDAMKRNLQYVPEFGRWDDLYEFIGTPLEKDAFALMRKQLELDVQCKTPSLLAKWLKSENTSSHQSRELANKTRIYLGMTHKEYRKTLSILRERIRVLERLMSAGRWDEIEFDKIPSRAGIIYRNAFARHDIERMREGAVQSYADFAKDKDTKVNAKALYPYEVVEKAMEFGNSWGNYYYSHTKSNDLDNTERLMVNKYWDNLADYFNGCSFNGICVADTSGSMYGQPMAVAISIAMYCAERNKGEFANHFFTFSDNPDFIEIEGVDFVDKVNRISRADWGGSTNIEAVFDMMLRIAKTNHVSQNDIPKSVIIVSDMEFNMCVSGNSRVTDRYGYSRYGGADETLFETIEKRWNAAGYKLPLLTFWNVQARQDNIPMRSTKYVNYVSGFSPVIFEQVLKGITAVDLMMDKLDSERYACIH
jgi:hypothetical protein